MGVERREGNKVREMDHTTEKMKRDMRELERQRLRKIYNRKGEGV